MRRALVLVSVVVLTLAIVPGWSGEERLDLLGPDGRMTARRVAIDPRDPAHVRIGGLTYLGGVELRSPDPAFGGYSALHVAGDAFTLLSDGGNVVRFRMGGDWRPRDVRFSYLPAGPRTGWEKRDRDSESLAYDPRSRRWWVGFESVNQLWRYAPGFVRAERMVAPPLMRKWKTAGGPESFTRLADGRFVAIAEQARKRRDWREGLVWPGDPTEHAPTIRFGYRPTAGYDPSDMAELPDGRLVVLERAFGLPFRWYARVVVVGRDLLRSGRIAGGRTVARLAPPLLTDNFEGVAAVREGGATILWIVSDDNQMLLERTLLLKFRLDG